MESHIGYPRLLRSLNASDDRLRNPQSPADFGRQLSGDRLLDMSSYKLQVG